MQMQMRRYTSFLQEILKSSIAFLKRVFWSIIFLKYRNNLFHTLLTDKLLCSVCDFFFWYFTAGFNKWPLQICTSGIGDCAI